MPQPVRDCPCHSGLRYAGCCRPYHERLRSAPTPEALMRSRYSAFALGLDTYLDRTLVRDHPHRDTAPPPPGFRYLGLRILHAEDDEVLFVARIFDKGADRSFAELSRFTREPSDLPGEGLVWRYADGDLLEARLLPPSLDKLTRDSFLALVQKHAMAN
jgi:SEC-C motif-containing protein